MKHPNPLADLRKTLFDVTGQTKQTERITQNLCVKLRMQQERFRHENGGWKHIHRTSFETFFETLKKTDYSSQNCKN